MRLTTDQVASRAIRIDDTLIHAVSANRTWLFARSPETGAVLWRAAVASQRQDDPHLSGDSRIVAIGPALGQGRREVRVYDRADGAFLWSTWAHTFTVHAGSIYTATGWTASGHMLVSAFDSLTGSELWRVATGESHWIGPIIADDRGVLAVSDPLRTMLRPDGRVRWHQPNGGISDLMMFDGDVFTMLSDEDELPIARLGLLDGGTVWRQPSEGTPPATEFVAASPDAVLVTDDHWRLRRRDRVTGESAWLTDTWSTTKVTAAGSLLFLPDNSDGVVVRSIETGELVTRIGDADLQVRPEGLFVSRGQLFATSERTLTSYAL